MFTLEGEPGVEQDWEAAEEASGWLTGGVVDASVVGSDIAVGVTLVPLEWSAEEWVIWLCSAAS